MWASFCRYPGILVSCLLAAAAAAGCREASAPQAVAPQVANVPSLPAPRVATPEGVFLVKPYVQLGNAPALSSSERLEILWHTRDADTQWSLQSRSANGGAWRQSDPPTLRRIAAPGITPHRVWRVALEGLTPGAPFDYRIFKDGKEVFAARGRARKSAGQPYRFVVFGDCAAGTRAQKAVAYQVHRADPDFVFLAGDIVYDRGRISEYRRHYFPIYNAETASPQSGAPLLRSTLFLAAPGNHDVLASNLRRYPDGMAYFLYWSQPLNGPLSTISAPGAPRLSGPSAHQQAFQNAAQRAYPRMANFSFRYGNAAWIVLDANYYTEWTGGTLRVWLEQELMRTQDAAWRFVAFHEPPFSSSKKHFDYQKMRVLAPVFEKQNVDMVFAGHVHNYQRTYPMRFTPIKNSNGRWEDSRGRVAGTWTLDKAFDGRTQTRPDGVLYLISGAGGASLYNRSQESDRTSWQPYTHTFLSGTYSFTVVDVNGKTLTVRQLSDAGKELDRFTVTK